MCLYWSWWAAYSGSAISAGPQIGIHGTCAKADVSCVVDARKAPRPGGGNFFMIWNPCPKAQRRSKFRWRRLTGQRWRTCDPPSIACRPQEAWDKNFVGRRTLLHLGRSKIGWVPTWRCRDGDWTVSSTGYGSSGDYRIPCMREKQFLYLVVNSAQVGAESHSEVATAK